MQESNFTTQVGYTTALKNKIKTKTACVGVIGVGYVGRPVVEFASQAGFRSIGFDIDLPKIEALNSLNNDLISATDNFQLLTACDIVCICVPTPINKDNSPDLSMVENAVAKVAATLRPGQLIILESSVAPGTTRRFVLPILKAKNSLAEGVDFFLANSPERIDPGNKNYSLINTPKLVGGYDTDSLELAVGFYQSFIETVVPVSTIEVAEMSKMLENTFRFVNISLINEMSDYAREKGINIWEVVEAASTKPYAFMPHYPSAGIGGHCIPVDPYYLIDDANKIGAPMQILNKVAQYHEDRPRKIVETALSMVNRENREEPIKILILGLAYKAGSMDARESPSIKIWKIAESMGAEVSYHDPHVPRLNGWSSKEMTLELLREHDLIIIATDHKEVPYELLIEAGKPVLDTRNVFKDITAEFIYRI